MDLAISKAAATVNGQEVIASDISFVPEQETVTLTFPNELPVGEGVLEALFKGNLNDKMKGFYRSKYYTAAGEERYGGVTQLYVTQRIYCWTCT